MEIKNKAITTGRTGLGQFFEKEIEPLFMCEGEIRFRNRNRRK